MPPRYKNITVKKPNGGTRKQRVQVLKSGKYKFVKNKTRGKSTPKRRPAAKKRTTTTRRRKAYMPRKKKQYRSRKMTLPLGLLIPMGYGAHRVYRKVRDAPDGMKDTEFLHGMTGIWWPENESPQLTTNNGGAAFPIYTTAGVVIHKGIGHHLGVNRQLAAARVPFVRV